MDHQLLVQGLSHYLSSEAMPPFQIIEQRPIKEREGIISELATISMYDCCGTKDELMFALAHIVRTTINMFKKDDVLEKGLDHIVPEKVWIEEKTLYFQCYMCTVST